MRIRGLSIVLSSLYEKEFVPYAITFGSFRQTVNDGNRVIFKFLPARTYLLDASDLSSKQAYMLGYFKQAWQTDPQFWELFPQYKEYAQVQKTALGTISLELIKDCLESFPRLFSGYLVGHCFFSYIQSSLGLQLPENILQMVHDTAIHESLRLSGKPLNQPHYKVFQSQNLDLHGCNLQETCARRGITADSAWTDPAVRAKAAGELAGLQLLERDQVKL